MQKKCPICGSEDVTEKVNEQQLSLPYGDDSTFKVTELYCDECEEFTIDRESSDEALSEALASGKMDSVNRMLDFLSENGVTNAYLERALDLPVRTVARWKKGKFSASSLALLRMVRTFEWLLEVAEVNYREPDSTQIMLKHNIELLLERLAPEHKLTQSFHGKSDLGSAAGAVFENPEGEASVTYGMFQTTASPGSVTQNITAIISSSKSPRGRLGEEEVH
jgi:hypothetical protein